MDKNPHKARKDKETILLLKDLEQLESNVSLTSLGQKIAWLNLQIETLLETQIERFNRYEKLLRQLDNDICVLEKKLEKKLEKSCLKK